MKKTREREYNDWGFVKYRPGHDLNPLEVLIYLLLFGLLALAIGGIIN